VLSAVKRITRNGCLSTVPQGKSQYHCKLGVLQELPDKLVTMCSLLPDIGLLLAIELINASESFQ
jgi:hypothetical protein